MWMTMMMQLLLLLHGVVTLHYQDGNRSVKTPSAAALHDGQEG
jgi:hypothetical protein